MKEKLVLMADQENVQQPLSDYSGQVDPLVLPSLWNLDQQKLLQCHYSYHVNMVKVFKHVAEKGPDSLQNMKMPKRPGSSLSSIVGEKRKKKDFDPKELHEYLKASIVDTSVAVNREAFSDTIFNETTNTEIIVDRLQRAVRNMKRNDAQTLWFSIQFGHFLSLCKQWYEDCKKKGTMTKTWAEWLKETCDYSDVHGRKLRILSDLLFHYPQFRCVGLSFRWVYSKKTEIETMLAIREYNDFWKSRVKISMTQQLSRIEEEITSEISHDATQLSRIEENTTPNDQSTN